ncbi:MAG: acetolactate synthase small subunit [Bacteroidetes bacterium]|nr:acetolactate synthase small subunit [Bacteroidota bacterium]MCH8232057.1 acetolactate synthase small subunit [Bacteroidota bacterium]
MEKRRFTISVFSEDRIGLLHSITIIFTRRKLSIESINSSESERKGIYRYTIVFSSDYNMARNVTKQIDKLIDVLRAFLHEEEQIIHREIALYKVATSSFYNGNEVEQLLRKHSANIIRIEQDYLVIEKTGWKKETQALLKDLEPYNLLEFARSARVVVTKRWKRLHKNVLELEQEH